MSQSNPKKRKAEDEAPASEEKYTSNSVMNNIRDSDKRQVKPREIVRLLQFPNCVNIQTSGNRRVL